MIESILTTLATLERPLWVLAVLYPIVLGLVRYGEELRSAPEAATATLDRDIELARFRTAA